MLSGARINGVYSRKLKSLSLLRVSDKEPKSHPGLEVIKLVSCSNEHESSLA